MRLFRVAIIVLICGLGYGQQNFELLENVVRTGKLEVLKQAIDKNPDLLTYENHHGYTLLILAAYNDQPEIATYLLSKGVNVDEADTSGNTALMGAAFLGNTAMVALLLNAKANVNLQNYNGATALHFASTFGKVDVVNTLLAVKANPFLKNNLGDTPSMSAIKQGNKEMADYIENYKVE
ncbi:ankyrin repeat domain-containing protein [Aquimarina hainanensis]|uniref:Ankyrin repeat domain-containing protein n=1 Tax=Aquimarina hainanensis TaxID=1578017 RepID=A0ABW5NA37_9FLAO|nr:ankyrin repeat domain-containing protein [Aquimarina sp. TRL1]QKX07001.1 ankyrin repeat domain-containing protein [Aquimarina sp. TRL1]